MSEARRQADAAKRRRLEMFIVLFCTVLLTEGKAPTPTRLNMWMGKVRSNNLNGELTRWRTFLLREFGFRKVKGKWVR